MKITKVDLTHTKVLRTACRFDVEDVEPISQTAWGNGRLMRPRQVTITVTNGKAGSFHITGPRLNKNGEGADITREWWSWSDLPPWLIELRNQARAAYVAEHGEPEEGDE